MISRNKISFGLLDDTKSFAFKLKANESAEYQALDLKEIVQVDFPENQYYKEQTEKKQIVLHHTVSGQGVDGDVSWWRQTAERVATSIIVGWDGKIYQCYSTLYWGYHLGVKTANSVLLNKQSIGIEIDSWGGLVKYNGKYYPAMWDIKSKKNVPNLKVKPIENVTLYPKGFMGYYAYESYTDAQIESVRKLLVFWSEKYNIPLTYNEKMWDLNQEALSGKAGVWTHVSFRGNGKTDCHPDINLVNMLKTLK